VASAEDLFRQACELTRVTPSADMDPDVRIWLLIGALSEALWRRAREREPGFSLVEHVCRAEYRPESADELTLWAELTSPHNYPAVARYVEKWAGQVNGGAARLHAALLRDARARSERERAAGDAGPG
jgi:hypothetical protein